MKTLHLFASRDKDIQSAAGLLAGGGVVAFPTETVYGLGARSDEKTSVENLYRIKKRPLAKKAAILVPDIPAAEEFVGALSKSARRLAERHWPGPLTLVVPDGDDFTGLRCPDCDAVLRMLRMARVPVMAPSANLSGGSPAVTAGEVLDVFDGKISAVLDGGKCSVGRASTVVRVTGEKLEVLREGPVRVEGAALDK